MFKRIKNEPVDIAPTANASNAENLSANSNSADTGSNTLDLQANQHVSIISNDLTILGSDLKIISEGAIRVDGEIQGEIEGVDVTVGRHGKVIGTVSGKRVKIDGQVAGTIRAKLVTFSAHARVEGDVHHQTISIDQGARFEGCSRRTEYVALTKPEIEQHKPALHSLEHIESLESPDIIHLEPSALTK